MASAAHGSEMSGVLKADWEARDFIHTISRGIVDLTEFLQRFEGHARDKMASLDTRLERIERSMATFEARAQPTK
ncbi:hypothetical protein BC831DRAFT_514732 [Entophlyctis helioformis]|nr:hypothetical protein BC831DRAFT_514732 [Entophlyctis helioformis]